MGVRSQGILQYTDKKVGIPTSTSHTVQGSGGLRLRDLEARGVTSLVDDYSLYVWSWAYTIILATRLVMLRSAKSCSGPQYSPCVSNLTVVALRRDIPDTGTHYESLPPLKAVLLCVVDQREVCKRIPAMVYICKCRGELRTEAKGYLK